MKFSTVFTSSMALLSGMAIATSASDFNSAVASPAKAGLRASVNTPRGLEGLTLEERIANTAGDLLVAQSAFDEQKAIVDALRVECKALNDITKAARDEFKAANIAWKAEPKGDSKDELKKVRDELLATFQAARDVAKPKNLERKEEVKKLRKLRKRHNNMRKKTNRLKKKLRVRKRKARKKQADVKKELVDGNCVADHICAAIRGDPHITTFDGLKYDCQGEGEFVLAKAINSDSSFEVQARFKSVGKSKMVTITQAISIDTGVEGAPDVDIFTEKMDNGDCALFYYIDGAPVDFSTPVPGISYEGNGDSDDNDKADYLFFTDSGIMFSTYAKAGNFGCVLNSKLCLPPSLLQEETIIGLLGTPDNNKNNDWTTPDGNALSQAVTHKAVAYDMCTTHWCVRDEADSIMGYLGDDTHATHFNCDAPYDPSNDELLLDPPEECIECCAQHPLQEMYFECIEECAVAPEGLGVDQCVIDMEDAVVLNDVEKQCKDPVVPEDPEDPTDKSFPAPPKETEAPTPAPTIGSGSGDPHFKTWTGDKYDYHGECDLVLLDHPSFNNGQGLRVHIRTTRVKYFSYIEQVAVQIGKDVLEFNNDVENFLINGYKVEANQKHHKTTLGGFTIRRDPKALSIRLHDEGRKHHNGHNVAKIDLHMRKNGFPAVIVNGGETEIFKGSLGLLGDWSTGLKIARDGATVHDDATEFALEWQVRDSEPLLFMDARFPQFPTTCTPPAAQTGGRLGNEMARKEAEEACAHWEEDQDDCIFDVIATRDVLVAEEGHIVQME